MNSLDGSAVFSEGTPSSPSYLLNGSEESIANELSDSTQNLNQEELEQRAEELLATLPLSTVPTYALQFDHSHPTSTNPNSHSIPSQWNDSNPDEPKRIVLPRDPFVARPGIDLKEEMEESIAFLENAVAQLDETDWIYKTPNAFRNGPSGADQLGDGEENTEPWLSTIF